MEGELLLSSGQGQGRSGSGLVQVWFRLQLKFHSLELDSEVGRVVLIPYVVERKCECAKAEQN